MCLEAKAKGEGGGQEMVEKPVEVEEGAGFLQMVETKVTLS